MTGIELVCMLSEDLSHVTSCYLVCKDPWHPPDAPNSLRGCCSTLLSKSAKGSTRMLALHCSYSWWEVFSYHKSSNHSSLCLSHMWKPFIVTMYWLFFFSDGEWIEAIEWFTGLECASSEEWGVPLSFQSQELFPLILAIRDQLISPSLTTKGGSRIVQGPWWWEWGWGQRSNKRRREGYPGMRAFQAPIWGRSMD